MMLLAAYLGDPHVDVIAGLTTALAGLMIGACLGFSALSSPRDLGISVLLSVAFAVLAITTLGLWKCLHTFEEVLKIQIRIQETSLFRIFPVV